jgi:hypothetical protein
VHACMGTPHQTRKAQQWALLDGPSQGAAASIDHTREKSAHNAPRQAQASCRAW